MSDTKTSQTAKSVKAAPLPHATAVSRQNDSIAVAPMIKGICSSIRVLRELLVPGCEVVLPLTIAQVAELVEARKALGKIIDLLQVHNLLHALGDYSIAKQLTDPATAEQISNLQEKRDATLAAIASISDANGATKA